MQTAREIVSALIIEGRDGHMLCSYAGHVP